MKVFSIDPGTECTGIYINDNGAGSSVTVRRPQGAERYDHLHDIREAVAFHAQGADLALVEDYPYGLPTGRSAYAVEAGAVVREVLAAMGIPIVVIPIQTWKALTIGRMEKGTKEKDRLYCAAVLDKYQRGFVTTDEADAFLIYMAAWRITKDEEIETETAVRIRMDIAAARMKAAKRTAKRGDHDTH